MNEKEDVFTYEYTARRQREIMAIRDKYLRRPDELSPMDELRRLDAGVTKKGTLVSLLVGLLSCLIMGAGMSCVMVWGDRLFFPGVLIGLIGLAGVICAYPLYSHITRKERERLAPEILKLADELLK